jgi:ribosomal protein S18 acetylase RimI-like enzyme
LSLSIRKMELNDLPAVFELGQKLFTADKWPTLYRSWDDNELLQLFESGDELCLVAEAQGRVVGFVLGSLMEKPRSAWRYGWLEWLAVEPQYHRRGVGKRLLNQLTELFVERETRIMLVDTDEQNAGALAFFRENGFGRELRHVYLSQNLDGHPRAVERKNGQKNGE